MLLAESNRVSLYCLRVYRQRQVATSVLAILHYSNIVPEVGFAPTNPKEMIYSHPALSTCIFWRSPSIFELEYVQRLRRGRSDRVLCLHFPNYAVTRYDYIVT